MRVINIPYGLRVKIKYLLGGCIMAHTDEFKKVLEDIKNQANEFNKPYTHNHKGENKK